MTTNRISEGAHEVKKTHAAIVEGAFAGERLSLSRVRSQVPPGLMTKAMFMEKTGLTVNEFRTLVASGKLKPVSRSARGWALYDDACIEKLKMNPVNSRARKLASMSRRHWRSYSEAEAMAVFEEIEKGTPLTTVVLKYKIHPTLVGVIRDDYALLNKGVVLPRGVMDQINRLEGRIDGVFPIQNAEDLLRLIDRLVSRAACTSCKSQPRKLCVECARERFSIQIQTASSLQPSADAVGEQSDPSR
jgi:hypothetical protein